MKLLACGVRGTAAVTDPAYSEFGGDTSCYLVEDRNGSCVIVDAGSGLRRADLLLRERGDLRPVLMLLTHYHLDHLVGLPQFSLLYNPEAIVEIAAPHGSHDVMSVLNRLIAEPFWPVTLGSMKARIRFTDLPADGGRGRVHGGLSYHWCPVHHPGACMAYRFDEEATGQSIVIATDVEWAAASAAEKSIFLALCSKPTPADVLVFDGHIIPEQYSQYKGWGHSRWTDCVDIVKKTGVRRLLVTHHAPDHPDKIVRAQEAALREALPGASFLRQGDWITPG